MAVEPKRGCGFRKVGGLYLVSGGGGVPCDRLPLELSVCPCCHAGFKQSRGWTWIDVNLLFGGENHFTGKVAGELGQGIPCGCFADCPLCKNVKAIGKAGLMWIGEKFYKTPADFKREGIAMGISRRVAAIPRNFEVGKTWILLAHPKVIPGTEPDSEALAGYLSRGMDETEAIRQAVKPILKPGVFYLWRPSAIERICKESERDSEMVADLVKRGITPVFVPDNDKDHMGSVHDRAEETEDEETAVPVE